jgi:hypothetical protein
LESNYYQTLNVEEDAEPAQIEAAYQRLAAKHQADAGGANDGYEWTARLREAHRVLGDSELRWEYDQARLVDGQDAQLDREVQEPALDSVAPPTIEVASSQRQIKADADPTPRETSDTPRLAPFLGVCLALVGIAFGLWIFSIPTSGLLPSTRPEQVPVEPAVAAAPTTMPVPPTSTPLPTAIPTAAPTIKPLQVVGTVYVSAGGEGVYVRSRPALDARVKAWPDGTPLSLIEYPLLGWALVQAPDGYVGYVPREYLLDKPPPVPTVRKNLALDVSIANLRYEPWGSPVRESDPCGPIDEGDPSYRLAYELTVANRSNEPFEWRLGLGVQLSGKVSLPACCYRYGSQAALAPPLSPGANGVVTCFSFLRQSYGELLADQRIGMDWNGYKWRWHVENGKAVPE